MPGSAMLSKLGIGGRLFLAFAVIMALSLISGLVGWIELRQIAGTQSTITSSAMPAATEARGVAEASARLIARSPQLTGASTEARRQSEATALFAEADALRGRLADLTRYGFDTQAVDALEGSVDRLLKNLSEQNDLVARRLALGNRADGLLNDALDAAIGLVDLSETLVANAATGTSAVISNLYDLVEDPEEIERTLSALDRLVESDVYLMERMFELRLRSSQIGLLLNQLNKTDESQEIDSLEGTLDHNLQILARRIDSVPDPVRRRQAEELFARLFLATAEVNDANVFQLRREMLDIASEIERLSGENRQLSEALSRQVVGLVDESRAFTENATREADSAVHIGLVTLLTVTGASLVVAMLIILFYVRRNVINRLKYLAGRMVDLAKGNLDVQVEASGSDELTEMARTIQFFKQEATRKRELEIERERTEIELRRHKEELEQLVGERTRQLSDTNRQLTHEVENHAKARERAEQASRAKSEFLATMSHEIRTPMSGVLGMLRVLGGSSLSADQRKQLEIVESSGEGLLGILNDILDYSKIESGHVEVEKTDFDLSDLVGGIHSLMRPRAREKGIELDIDYGEGVPTLLKGDPGKIRQVLFNLIGNGLKFTDRGRVVLGIERVADGDRAPISLRFEVSDTGIGLPEDTESQVFDAFSQLDASISRRYGGTGLGLAICKKLVDALGGDIGVESTLGVGSRFWFTLGFEPGDEEAIARQAPASRNVRSGDTQRRAILLVEDNEINRLVAKSFLENMGHQVTLAMDGRQAVEAVERGDFDAVLMDISMPEMDGMEATKRIRALADPGKSTVPIIAMSAHVFSSEIDDHLKAGMNAFIGKPMSPERMEDVLAHALSGETATARPPRHAEPLDAKDPDSAAREILAEDLEILGPERTGRMVELFLESTPVRVRELGTAIESGDFDSIRFAAHGLKSSAGSLGLTRLAGRLDALESAAHERKVEELGDLYEGFDALYEQSTRLLTRTWEALRS